MSEELSKGGLKTEVSSKIWLVTFGGFEIYDGPDEEKAYAAYIKAGPYGRIWEIDG